MPPSVAVGWANSEFGSEEKALEAMPDHGFEPISCTATGEWPFRNYGSLWDQAADTCILCLVLDCPLGGFQMDVSFVDRTAQDRVDPCSGRSSSVVWSSFVF